MLQCFVAVVIVVVVSTGVAVVVVSGQTGLRGLSLYYEGVAPIPTVCTKNEPEHSSQKNFIAIINHKKWSTEWV